MPSGRGVLVFASGILMWVGARMLGSPTLHMVAVGLVLLPFAAALFARWTRQRIRIRRRLSDTRVQPGQRVHVELEVENQSPAKLMSCAANSRLKARLRRSRSR